MGPSEAPVRSSGGSDFHHHNPELHPPQPGESSDELRHDIENTRDEIDETINALSEKLTPSTLLNEAMNWAGVDKRSAKSSAKNAASSAAHSAGHLAATAASAVGHALGSAGSTAADWAGDMASYVGHGVISAVRNHPLPAALIGAGIAWAIYQNTQDHEHELDYDDDELWSLYMNEQYQNASMTEAEAQALQGAGQNTGRPDDRVYAASLVATTVEPADALLACPDMGQQSGQPFDYPRGQQGQGQQHGQQGFLGRAASGVAGAASSAYHTAADAAQGVGHVAAQAGHYAAQAGHLAGQAGQYAYQAGRGAAQYANQAAHGVANAADYAYDQARYGARVAGHKVNEWSHEYPLAVAALGAVAGLAIGMLLPSTRREERLLGERGEELRRRARTAGRQAYNSVLEAADRTASAIGREAERQGLTPDRLADKVQHVWDHTKQAAREEGLTPDQLKNKAGEVASRAKDSAKDVADQKADEARSAANRSRPNEASGTDRDKNEPTISTTPDVSKIGNK